MLTPIEAEVFTKRRDDDRYASWPPPEKRAVKMWSEERFDAVEILATLPDGSQVCITLTTDLVAKLHAQAQQAKRARAPSSRPTAAERHTWTDPETGDRYKTNFKKGVVCSKCGATKRVSVNGYHRATVLFTLPDGTLVTGPDATTRFPRCGETPAEYRARIGDIGD